MKGRIKQHGAPVYDSPAPRGSHKVFDLAPGTTVEVLEGNYGSFYAVKVHGRGEPAYIRRVHVDIEPDSDILTYIRRFHMDVQPDSDIPTEGTSPKWGTGLAGCLYGLLIGLLGFILMCYGWGVALVHMGNGSPPMTAEEDVAFYVLFFGGLFLIFGGPIFFWWLLPFLRKDKDK
jgi:hypothetical protein